MPESSAKRSKSARSPRRNKPTAGRAAKREPASPPPAHLAALAAELGSERLEFLEAECSREYWQDLPDALRHVVDLRMRAQFRAAQRRALARVRSLLKRERRRLAQRSAEADTRLAVRRTIEQIEAGHDAELKSGLRLLRAIEARDTAALQELTRWKPPEPPARRRLS